MVKSVRKMQISLLLGAIVYFIMGGIVLSLNELVEFKIFFLGVLAVSLGFWFLIIFLYFKGYEGDPFLLPLLAMMIFTSLIFLARLNMFYAERQFIWILGGFLILMLTTIVFSDYKKLANYKYVLVVLGVIFLLLPIFLGSEHGGAKSWLDFGIFSLQPSEFVKIILVLFLASFLSENSLAIKQKLHIPQVWGPLLGMWGISLLILVFQRDLGTALIYFGAFLSMIYLASSRIIYVLLGLFLFGLGAFFAGQLFDHVAVRYLIWVNPWDYIHNEGYQIVQSLFALAAGGLGGVGLGGGYPDFIPAVHTDFIFSAIGEEMGLLGEVGVLLLYLCFIYRGFLIALRAKDDFSAMVAGGLTALMGLQAFIIVAGVIKLLPLTGVTLPFISYGGSSLMANFIIVGMLMNISHQSHKL